MEQNEETCNVDDLMCQMRILSHLEGIQGILGDDRFKSDFPELEGLGPKIAEKIQSSESSIRDAFARCGLPTPSVAEEKEVENETRAEETTV